MFGFYLKYNGGSHQQVTETTGQYQEDVQIVHISERPGKGTPGPPAVGLACQSCAIPAPGHEPTHCEDGKHSYLLAHKPVIGLLQPGLCQLCGPSDSVSHYEMSKCAYLYHLPSFCPLRWIGQEYDPPPPLHMRNHRGYMVGPRFCS